MIWILVWFELGKETSKQKKSITDLAVLQLIVGDYVTNITSRREKGELEVEDSLIFYLEVFKLNMYCTFVKMFVWEIFKKKKPHW